MQAPQANHLPQPDEQSLAHSAAVVDHIRGLIDAAGGSIPFSEFMHNALYAPGLGYYSAGATKFGAAGDFVTAPEISSLFSRVLARQAENILRQFDDKDEPGILEIGAGSGVLAVELLRKLDELECLPMHYDILEVSPDLRERQIEVLQAMLPAHASRVRWLDRLPTSFSGVVIANEVIDALPVERFVKQQGRVFRQTVGWSDGRFTWGTGAANAKLREAVQEAEAIVGTPLTDGYRSEVLLAADDWIAQLGEAVDRGTVFLFDYGVGRREYYAIDRNEGWLRCHFRHYAHNDPLIYPGIQDLTAWVDFSRIAEAAADSGFHIAGYVTQGQFLLHGGLVEEMQHFAGLPTAAQIELSGQVKLLTMPGEMGENVKCLELTKGLLDPADVFTLADRAHTL